MNDSQVGEEENIDLPRSVPQGGLNSKPAENNTSREPAVQYAEI